MDFGLLVSDRRVQGLGFRVSDFESCVQGLRSRVLDLVLFKGLGLMP
jgi:hypothetical protein